MNDLISVIVPVYNVEGYLDECLSSVINQTYKNLEIIIINDGSTDKSLSICKKYAKKDKRIKLINQENHGLSYCRNYGISLSTGMYIAFVDSDDILDVKMYEILHKELVENKCDFSISAFREFKDSFVQNDKYDYSFEIMSKEYFIKELMKDKKITNHVWNKLYKRELFKDVSFPLNRKYEDIGTLYKVVEKSNDIVYIEFELYGYRKRETSIVNNLKKQTLLDYIEMIRVRYDYLVGKFPDLKDYFDMNKINSTTRCYLDIIRTKNEDFFDEQEIIKLLKNELSISKKLISFKTIRLSSLRENIANTLLMVSLKLFIFVMRIFYKFK